MRYTLYFTYTGTYEDIDVSFKDFAYTVNENLDDIIDFYFLKEYGKKYKDSTNWYLEKGAKEFVKNLETLWFKNEIDTWKLYHDYDFISYLKEEYLNQVCHEFVTRNDLVKPWYETVEKDYIDLYE